MNRSILVGSFTLAAVLASACIPNRDNPADPAGAPDVSVSVAPLEGGGHTPFTFTATPADPGVPYRYTWDLFDPQWDAGTNPATLQVSTGTSGVLVTSLTLTSAMISASGGANGLGLAVRRVQMRAAAPNGHYLQKTINVVLRNSAPVVDAGGDVFYTPGRTAAVVLDACGGVADGCTSTDAEGDPLRFQWSQLGGPTVTISTLDSSGRFASFVPPAQTAEISFRITANDGLASSKGYVSAYPSHQVWIGTVAPNQVYRIFPEFSVRSGFRNGASTSPFGQILRVAAANGSVWEGDYNPGTIRLLSSEFELASSFSLSDPTPVWIAPTAADSACVAASSAAVANAPGAFYRLKVGAAVVRVADNKPSAVVPVNDGSGDCWTVGEKIGKLSTTGTYTVVDPGPYDFSRSATQTADGALWVRMTNYTGHERLMRLAPGATTLTTILDSANPGSQNLLAGYTVLSPDPADAAGHGVIEGLKGGLTTSPVVEFGPSGMTGTTPLAFGDVTAWTWDSTRNALWVSTPDAGEIQRWVYRDGAWALASSMEWLAIGPQERVPFNGLSVDPATGTAFAAFTKTGATTSLLARLPSHLRRIETVPFESTSGFSLAGDPSSGRVWISESYGRVVSRRNDHGTILVSYPQSTGSTGIVARQDGSAYFGLVSPARIGFVDGTNAPQVETALGAGVSPGEVKLTPDDSVACIAAAGGAAPWRLQTAAGQVDTLTAFTGPSYPWRTAATPSGGCWFFSGYASTGTASWVPSGSSTIAGTATGFSPASDFSGAADPFDDSVWVADEKNGRVVHVSTAGAVLQPITVPATRVGLYSCSSPVSLVCVEGWTIDQTSATATRFNGAGAQETYTIPLGTPLELSVVP